MKKSLIFKLLGMTLLNPLGKGVDLDILFLGPPSGILLTRVHDDIKILLSWKWERFPVFRALAQNISQLLVTDYVEITCHYKSTWSVQKFRITAGTRCGVLGKTMEVYLPQTCFVIENVGSNWMGIAIRNDSLYWSIEGFYFGWIVVVLWRGSARGSKRFFIRPEGGVSDKLNA